MEYDLLIRGGTLVDGSGAPRKRADIAIKSGKIAALVDPADSEEVVAQRSIDATGLVVAPGFIDLHSHSDWVAPIPEHAAILKPFLLQGVTTFVGGNCGFSVAPVRRERSRMLDESGQMLSERKFAWDWQEVSEFSAHLKRQGLALNVAHLAGHGSIRLCVMGADAGEPSAEQLREMQAMLERAMADGAVGLSTGLGYFPGMIAKPDELAAMARVAGAAGGVLTSHLRAYSTRSLFFQSDVPHNLLAVREMIDVARQARVPLQISHLIFVGRRTWPTAREIVDDIEHASHDGVDVAFDTFPYTCGNTTIRVIFPAWSQNHLEELLDSTDGWARLRDGFQPLRSFIAQGVQLMWAVKPELAHFEGKFFGEIADAMKLDPVEAYLTIARESGTRARVLNHLYSGDDAGDEEALQTAMSHRLNAFEMDTILTSHGHHNPASFGTYPRILGYYVRELGLLTLENAIYKMTGMAAERMHLKDRGLVRKDFAADLCIFNAETVGCDADSRSPNQNPIGIEHVLVNGKALIENGQWRGDGVLAGEWLSRG
ncbi:MAG TPA: amidohydrolase family protein [Candidatus Binataceae bacterium]|nr:amidohydrolase family protein [Candidatus Binataceae bacterium]